MLSSSGGGTTWVTYTPAPSGPSSLARALLPTKETVMNTGSSSRRTSSMVLTTGM